MKKTQIKYVGSAGGEGVTIGRRLQVSARHEAGGFFSPQNPRTQGLRPLDTKKRIDIVGKSKQLPPVALRYERQRASGSRKAGKIPQGKACFPLGDFPGFPRMLCIRVGRFQRPGQKHSGDKLGLFSNNSGKLLARHIKRLPQVWVQGGHLPGGVWGKAPPSSSLSGK